MFGNLFRQNESSPVANKKTGEYPGTEQGGDFTTASQYDYVPEDESYGAWDALKHSVFNSNVTGMLSEKLDQVESQLSSSEIIPKEKLQKMYGIIFPKNMNTIEAEQYAEWVDENLQYDKYSSEHPFASTLMGFIGAVADPLLIGTTFAVTAVAGAMGGPVAALGVGATAVAARLGISMAFIRSGIVAPILALAKSAPKLTYLAKGALKYGTATALEEPIRSGLNESLNREYTTEESMGNIAAGTMLGMLTHGAGVIFKGKRYSAFMENLHAQKLTKEISNAVSGKPLGTTPETRKSAGTANGQQTKDGEPPSEFFTVTEKTKLAEKTKLTEHAQQFAATEIIAEAELEKSDLQIKAATLLKQKKQVPELKNNDIINIIVNNKKEIVDELNVNQKERLFTAGQLSTKFGLSETEANKIFKPYVNFINESDGTVTTFFTTHTDQAHHYISDTLDNKGLLKLKSTAKTKEGKQFFAEVIESKSGKGAITEKVGLLNEKTQKIQTAIDHLSATIEHEKSLLYSSFDNSLDDLSPAERELAALGDEVADEDLALLTSELDGLKTKLDSTKMEIEELKKNKEIKTKDITKEIDEAIQHNKLIDEQVAVIEKQIDDLDVDTKSKLSALKPATVFDKAKEKIKKTKEDVTGETQKAETEEAELLVADEKSSLELGLKDEAGSEPTRESELADRRRRLTAFNIKKINQLMRNYKGEKKSYKAFVSLISGGRNGAPDELNSLWNKFKGRQTRLVGRFANFLHSNNLINAWRKGTLDNDFVIEMENFGRETPIETGNKAAKQVAVFVHGIQKELMEESNRYGDNIKSLAGYIVKQVHNRIKIASASPEKFLKNALETWDLVKMYGKVLNEAAATKKILNFRDLMITNKIFGDNKISEIIRTIHFKDGKFKQWNDLFGIKYMADAVLSGIENMSKRATILEYLGDKPFYMLKKLAKHFNLTNSQHSSLESELRNIVGLGMGDLVKTAKAMSWVRAAVNSRLLKFLMISSLPDLVTSPMFMKSFGTNFLKAQYKSLAYTAQSMTSAEFKVWGRKLGIGMDSMSHSIKASTQDLSRTGFTEIYYKMSSMNIWQPGVCTATARMMEDELIQHAGMEFDKLPTLFANRLKEFGINADTWDKIRVSKKNGTIIPENVEDRDASVQLSVYYYAGQNIALNMMNSKSLNFSNQGLQHGTGMGELIRTFTDLKSYTYNFGRNTMGRGSRVAGNEGGALNQVEYAIEAAIGLLGMSYVSYNLKRKLNGYEMASPAELTKRDWLSIVVMAGPLWIFSGVERALSGQNKTTNIASSLAGPSYDFLGNTASKFLGAPSKFLDQGNTYYARQTTIDKWKRTSIGALIDIIPTTYWSAPIMDYAFVNRLRMIENPNYLYNFYDNASERQKTVTDFGHPRMFTTEESGASEFGEEDRFKEKIADDLAAEENMAKLGIKD